MKEPAPKTLQCEKHKKYQGLRETDRDCPGCQKLYRTVQRTIRETFNPSQPYQSLTTRGKRFGMLGFLAELSCVMLYSPLPPYFWKRNNKAARHFKTEILKLQKWKQRDGRVFESIHAVLYHTYTQYFERILAQRVRNKPITPGRVVVREDYEDEEDEEPVGVEYFGYDPEQVERQALGKRYRKREKEEEEEAKKEGR